MSDYNLSDLMSRNYIGVFTDGSSYIDKKKEYYEASSAVIIVINNIEVCRLGCFHVNGTNSIGEIYAMMLAIDKVEELKRDNPELRDYFTFYVSDSKYVVSSLTEWIFNWVKINENNKIWKSSSNQPISYQWIMKYLYNNYISDKAWRDKNLILHINGHVNNKSIGAAYKKALKRNSQKTWSYKKCITLNTFKELVSYNHIVDAIAEKIRSEKITYYEEGDENTQWVRRKRILPVRNQRFVIKSRTNESRI